jgi:hypothetical protein
MDNELVINKSWPERNWKWFLLFATLIILLFTALLTSNSKGDLTNIAQAYAENSLFEDAIAKANTNNRVLETVGKIEPIDKLAILEGSTIYTNNNNSVQLSVRIKGTKRSGKLDIAAQREGKKWNYEKIAIRIKNPKEEINVLN